jgi:radical SAM superfamily enzyme YgiQ (UPF0313 family)
MNILIIETVWMGDTSYSFFQKTLLTMFSILPTLQARELAAMTPKHHTVTVLNERYSQIDYHITYDVVLINFVTSTAPRAYAIADAFRKKGVCVVLSGFHASGLPEEAKQHADSVLIGRNESGWLTILKDIEQKNLQPFYHAPPYTSALRLPPTNIRLPGLVLTGAIEATRGCPYGCDFCPETNIPGGKSFYKRPVQEVIDEIISLPQRTFLFYDTSLTIDPIYSKELFNKMKGVHKKFFCNGNVDVLADDRELVRLSKQAGCIAWLVGFESINQNTLDSAGKTTNRVEKYIQAVHNIHQNHMAVIGDFIFGFDNDTTEVFEQTFLFIKKLNIDAADFSILTPFPGTPLFKRLDEQGRIITKQWKDYNMKHAVFTPKGMTPQELERGVQQIQNRFYGLAYTTQRLIHSLSLGIRPFMTMVMRNLMAMRRKQSSKVK